MVINFFEWFYWMQSAVKVSDVTFRNVHGTSADELAIDLVCSDNIGCTNISLQQINITSAIPGKKTYSRCNNAHGITKSTNPIVPCLYQWFYCFVCSGN